MFSLDAGLRMDGIPAFDLRDLVIEVFHSSPNQSHKAALDLWDIVIEVLRTTKDNIQPGHTSSRKLNHTSSGKLEYFNPTRQFVIPEPRPNLSIENKGLIN